MKNKYEILVETKINAAGYGNELFWHKTVFCTNKRLREAFNSCKSTSVILRAKVKTKFGRPPRKEEIIDYSNFIPGKFVEGYEHKFDTKKLKEFIEKNNTITHLEINFGFIVNESILESLGNTNFTIQEVKLTSKNTITIEFPRNKVLVAIHDSYLQISNGETNKKEELIESIKLFISTHLNTEEIFSSAITNSQKFIELYSFYIEESLKKKTDSASCSSAIGLEKIEELYFRKNLSAFQRAEILSPIYDEWRSISMDQNLSKEEKIARLEQSMENFKNTPGYEKAFSYKSGIKNFLCQAANTVNSFFSNDPAKFDRSTKKAFLATYDELLASLDNGSQHTLTIN